MSIKSRTNGLDGFRIFTAFPPKVFNEVFT